MKKIKTLIKGKKYLVERTTKAFGGGIEECLIENRTETRIKVFGKWHTIKSFNENYTILEELEDEEHDAD